MAGLIAASQRTAVAVEVQQIIGFARAITDGISNGYLSMVVVAEPFRRQGVGQALIQHIVGEEESITWVLRAGREGEPPRVLRRLFSLRGLSHEQEVEPVFT